MKPPPLRDDCFALPPGVEWTPVDVALAHLRQAMHCVAEAETVPLGAALGRILAADTQARRAHPAVANAAVDGYGFAFAALAQPPHVLPLCPGRAAAGAPFAGTVPQGQAIRILTGAQVPEGVDTIVLQEDCALSDGRIAFQKGLRRGANIRPAGEDCAEGAALLPQGHVLRAVDLGLLAATGHGAVSVRRPLRVGVLSTGDELAAPGAPMRPDQVPDANGPMLRAILAGWGMQAVDLGRAPDTRADLRAMLEGAAAACDAILTSGGASAGDEDHLSALLQAEGQHTLWRIAVKPGRPLALGLWRGVPIFGLPGNPVAAAVTTLIFVRPGLAALAGAGWQEVPGILVPAAFGKSKKAGRREYLRARLRQGSAEVFASEGSGRISGLSWADGLVELPDAAAEIAPGTPVRFLAYADLLRLGR